MARAESLLAQVPDGAPKRVLVLGDHLARREIEPRGITTPAGAIVHLADVRAGDGGVARVDDDPWAALPRATGGLLFEAAAPTIPIATAPDRRAIEEVFLEWARPVRLDRMVWRVPGMAAALHEEPRALEEGDSISYRAVQDSLPTSATIEGELWSRRFAKTIAPTANEAKLWSALVFGSDMQRELSDEESRVLAHAGGAVSPFTSYLATEPGVRPWSDEGGRGEGICLCWPIGAIGRGADLGTPDAFRIPDYQRVFASWMRRAVRTCGAEGRTSIVAETTRGEIVDVAVVVHGDVPDGSQAECVREATWALELPDELGHPHLDLRVAL